MDWSSRVFFVVVVVVLLPLLHNREGHRCFDELFFFLFELCGGGWLVG